MSMTMGDVILYLKANSEHMDRGLKEGEGRAKKWAGKVGGILKKGLKVAMIGAGAAVLAGVGIMVKAVDAAADAEEMIAKFEVTFGGAATNLSKDLEGFADSAGRSKFELKGMSADMGAVLKAMNLTELQSSQLAGSMTQLAVDVGSFNNQLAPEVADKFTKALTGEYESLKSLGIVVNQAMLEQELLNMGIEGGAKAANNADKVMARYNLIMAATGDAQGDAIRTSGSFTNQMLGLKASFKDTVTEVGMKLLPVLTPLLARFGEMARDVLPQLVSVFAEKVVPVIGQVVQAIMALTRGDMKGALTAIFGPEVSEKIMGIVGTVTTMRDKFKEVFDRVSEAISSFWTNTGEPIFTTVVQWLQEKIPPAIETLSNFWTNTLLPAIEAVWAFLKESIFPVFEAAANVTFAALGKAVEVLAGLWDNVLMPAFQAVGDWITNKAGPVFDKLGQALGPIRDLIDRVVQALKDFAEWLSNIKLPDWLDPGSPTPFEEGLRGISAAMDEITEKKMPRLTAEFARLRAGDPLRDATGSRRGPGGGEPSSIDQSRNFTVQQMNVMGNRDLNAVTAVLRNLSRA